MTLHTELAALGEETRASADLVERRLSRFRPEVQPRVRRLAAAHPWIADLAGSFPALLFALAFPRRGVDPTAALRLVTAGAPLRTVAAAAGAPMWMRSFPPGAFAAPLPDLPDSPAFRRRIANHPPSHWAQAPRWIEKVANAAVWGDEEIALWFAREAPLKEKKPKYRRRRPRDEWRLVCLWAWFSQRRQERAGALMQTTWRPALQWKAALEAARTWRDALALTLYLGEAGVEDVWLEGGVIDGYTFAPLRTAADIEVEAAAMGHCVRSYGSRLAYNCDRLWSVRKDGARVATLCVGNGYGPRPSIIELSGRENSEVADDVWMAARRWLFAQDARPFDAERMASRHTKDTVLEAAAWRVTWRPYWLAKRRIPDWLPLAPDENALYDL